MSRPSLVSDSPLVRYLASERAAEDYCNEVVDGAGRLLYVDRVGSVSGARRDEPSHVWDDQILDEQYRRFLKLECEE